MKTRLFTAIVVLLSLSSCDRTREERTGVRSDVKVEDTGRGRLRGAAEEGRLAGLDDGAFNTKVAGEIDEARRRLNLVGAQLVEVHKKADKDPAARDSMQGAFCGDLGKVDDQIAQTQELLPLAQSKESAERSEARGKIEHLLGAIKTELDTAEACAGNPGLPR